MSSVNNDNSATIVDNRNGDGEGAEIVKPDELANNKEAMTEIPVDSNITMQEVTDVSQLSGNIVINKNMDFSERMNNLKSWGLNTIMKTKQKMKEKLSRTSRTVDITLEDSIDMLKIQKSQYGMMVANNQRTIEQLKQLIIAHQYSARMDNDLAQTERTLVTSFLSQSQIEISTITNIKDLINKLVCSNETLETLVNKTFNDLLTTIQTYDNARIEFDAYKTETDRLVIQLQQKNNGSNNDQMHLQEMKNNLEQRRMRYESNKASVQIKIDLLEDHKNRVIQREMQNCGNAWCHYYTQCANLFPESISELQKSPNKSDKENEDQETIESDAHNN